MLPYVVQQDNNRVQEVMNAKDIYKELKLRGYQYHGAFRGLTSASSKGECGHIAWEQNWVTFMDCMLQMQILRTDTNSLLVPTEIQKVVLDPTLHAQHIARESTQTGDCRKFAYETNLETITIFTLFSRIFTQHTIGDQ